VRGQTERSRGVHLLWTVGSELETARENKGGSGARGMLRLPSEERESQILGDPSQNTRAVKGPSPDGENELKNYFQYTWGGKKEEKETPNRGKRLLWLPGRKGKVAGRMALTREAARVGKSKGDGGWMVLLPGAADP